MVRVPGNMNLCELIIIVALISLVPLKPQRISGQDLAVAPSPLADAAEARDTDQIRKLLTAGASINAAQVDGMTALHWAVRHDDSITVEMLIKANADVNAKNRYGVTPLSLACTNGTTGIVESLLKARANPNAALHGGETALMTAARTGILGPVNALIAAGADVNAREASSQTALMWAAADGHANVVRALIDAGADFRTPLKSGFTPLFLAVREGRSDVVRTLLDAGISVNDVMKPQRAGGKAPRKGTSPLMLAVENGHFELAVFLLEAGADPNDQRSGFTALHAITWTRKPNRGDGDDGEPPPQGSGHQTSLEFVKHLIRHGADVNTRLISGASGRGKLNQTGATPFLMAADTADVTLMKLLVELGADPRIPNADNSTPLMAAAGLGTLAPGEEAGTEAELLEAVQFALEQGGDVNGVDRNGETEMHGAAYNNAPQVVQWLADHGANIAVWNRPNKYGWTPLSIAEGHRPGNFKPSPDTISAIRRIMGASGKTPAGGAAGQQ